MPLLSSVKHNTLVFLMGWAICSSQIPKRQYSMGSDAVVNLLHPYSKAQNVSLYSQQLNNLDLRQVR